MELSVVTLKRYTSVNINGLSDGNTRLAKNCDR